jgi:hypothetical protein
MVPNGWNFLPSRRVWGMFEQINPFRKDCWFTKQSNPGNLLVNRGKVTSRTDSCPLITYLELQEFIKIDLQLIELATISLGWKIFNYLKARSSAR